MYRTRGKANLVAQRVNASRMHPKRYRFDSIQAYNQDRMQLAQRGLSCIDQLSWASTEGFGFGRDSIGLTGLACTTGSSLQLWKQ